MTFQKVLVIASYTFKEIFKSKILINVLFIGLGLVLLTFVATQFTYGVPERVALDFGLGTLSLSSLAISIFLGVGLLSKEIESRTVYMIISRPVPRYAFIFGKILGLMAIQFVNVLLLSGMTLASTALLGGKLDPLIYWAVAFILLESLLLLLVVVFVSLFANNILSVLLSGVVLLLGHGIRETQNTSLAQKSEFLKWTLEAYHFVLPAFYKLNLKDFVIYHSDLELNYLLSNLSYGLLYSLFLMCMIIFVFNRKNID